MYCRQPGCSGYAGFAEKGDVEHHTHPKPFPFYKRVPTEGMKLLPTLLEN